MTDTELEEIREEAETEGYYDSRVILELLTHIESLKMIIQKQNNFLALWKEEEADWIEERDSLKQERDRWKDGHKKIRKGVTVWPYPSDNDYWVSSSGRVFSYKQGSMRELKQTHLGARDYLSVSLHIEGKPTRLLIHRMMLETFVGPCPEGMFARHLDGDKYNNVITNLAWGTREENDRDKMLHGHFERGETHHDAKLTNKDIPDILRRLNESESCVSIAKDYNVHNGTINRIKQGKMWQHVEEVERLKLHVASAEKVRIMAEIFLDGFSDDYIEIISSAANLRAELTRHREAYPAND